MFEEALASLILSVGRRSLKAKMGHLDIKDANLPHRGFGILNRLSAPTDTLPLPTRMTRCYLAPQEGRLWQNGTGSG